MGFLASTSSFPKRTVYRPYGFLFLFILFFPLAAPQNEACYWPDGSKADGYFACDEFGQNGLCCHADDVCLNNGVCDAWTGKQHAYYRGTCSSKDWKKGKCPTVCLNETSGDADAAMGKCPKSDKFWFCFDENLSDVDCDSGKHILTFTQSLVTMTTVAPPSSATRGTTTTKPSATKETTGSTTNSTAMPSDPSGGSSVHPPASSATSSVIPPPAATESTEAPESEPKQKMNVTPLAVGVSVGGAAVIFGIVMGILWWRRKKRDDLARAESPPPRNTLDDLDPAFPGLIFRANSLHTQQSRNNMNGDFNSNNNNNNNNNNNPNGNMGGGGMNEMGSEGGINRMVSAASATSAGASASASAANRADSLRQGSILSSLHSHTGSNNANNRFAPGAGAMHDVPRSPSAGWDQGPNRQHKAPEIPYDGRRFAPYHGLPPSEIHGYSELPG